MKTPFLERDGPGSCQEISLWREYLQVHCQFGEQPALDGWFLQLILTWSVVQVYGDGRWVAQWDVNVFHR